MEESVILVHRAAAEYALDTTVKWLDSLEKDMGVLTRNLSILHRLTGAGVLTSWKRTNGHKPSFNILERADMKADICIRVKANLSTILEDQGLRLSPSEKRLVPSLQAGGIYKSGPHGNSGIGVASGRGGGGKNELIAGEYGRHYERRLKYLLRKG